MINKKGAVGFNSKLLLKLLIVAFSSFFWIYFLISSKLTVYAFRVFDLATILNSIFSLNFLLFAIFFPITSIIILSIIYNSIKEESLIVVGIGLFLSLIFAIIF